MSERMEKNELEQKIYDALWEAYNSGYENVKLYETGYMGHYMDSNSYDPDEGEILLSLNSNDVQDLPELEVPLDEYFSSRASEIADEIEQQNEEPLPPRKIDHSIGREDPNMRIECERRGMEFVEGYRTQDGRWVNGYCRHTKATDIPKKYRR